MKVDNNSFIHTKDPATSGIFYLPRIVSVLVLMLFAFSIRAQAVAKVEDAKQSFGIVTKGEVVELKYVITNAGNEPLLIQKFEVQCSCTSVIFDEKPVLPGNSTTVTVKFDTKTVYDRQDRIVTLTSNVKGGEIKLRFKGFVKRK